MQHCLKKSVMYFRKYSTQCKKTLIIFLQPDLQNSNTSYRLHTTHQYQKYTQIYFMAAINDENTNISIVTTHRDYKKYVRNVKNQKQIRIHKKHFKKCKYTDL